MPPLQRRAFISSLGATGVALLAGCGSNTGNSESTPVGTTTTPPTTTTTSSTTTNTTDASPPPLGEGPGPLPDATWPLPHRAASNCALLPDGASLSGDAAEDWRANATRGSAETRYTPEFSQPVIADGHVIAANRLLFGPNVEAPDKQFVRAFDANSGDQTWQYTIGSESDEAARGLPTTPAVWDDVVLVGHGETVRAVALDDGTDAWRRSLDTEIHAVVPAAEQVYVRGHRSIVALRGEDTRAWSTPLEAYPDQLAVGHRHLYVSTSRRVHALDPESGKEQWSVELPAVHGGYAVSRLATVRNGVIAMQNTGDLYGISDDGERSWTSERRYDAFVTDGTRVYVSSGGTLRALAVPTGEQQWVQPCSDVPNCGTETDFVPVALTDDSLVVAGNDGGLLGVSPTDGTPRWSLPDAPRLEGVALGPDALYGVNDTALFMIADT